jgi:UDP-hydrolysing UDP-N-acetyl-D-glucosamine 2-epimerase
VARRIAVVTTSRADYGGLFHLLGEIARDPGLELQLVVTGMHLAASQGGTVAAIVADGFTPAREVPMLLDRDDEASVAKSIGVGLLAFADVWRDLRPDVMVCFGDRFELLAPAIAALMQRVPIAHVHGGETSQGAVDEAVRHSLTKMASLHFPAAAPFARRLARMGEPEDRIFTVGAPALDALYRRPLLGRPELAARLGLELAEPTALVTYHPVTLELDDTDRQIASLLAALDRSGLAVVFTRANADAAGSRINAAAEAFCRAAPARRRMHDHLGQVAYLSCLRHLDVMIGNSSSGLVEAPSFRMPVVNVGNRQQGRLRAANVIDTGYGCEEILAGIRQALSREFRPSLDGMTSPYDVHGDGRTSARIKDVLKRVVLDGDMLKKVFNDGAAGNGT